MHVPAADFGVAASIVALVEGYCYNLSIVGFTPWWTKIPKEDRTIPSLAGLIILLAEGIIVALSYYKRQDWNDFWFFGAFAVEYAIAVWLASQYGEHRQPLKPGQEQPSIFTLLDVVCLMGALESLLIWIELGSWNVPIAMNIIIDFLGIALILEKLWRLPKSEDLRSWILTVIGSGLALVALGGFDSWNFERAGFPIYFLGINAIVLIILLRRYPLVKRIFRF